MRIAGIAFLGIAVSFVMQAEQGRGFGPGRGAPDLGFRTIDSDHDGILSAAEIEAAGTILAKLDKNSDGQISSEEISMAMPQGRGPGGRRGGRGEAEQQSASDVEETVTTLMSFDSNADRKLSRAELPERLQGTFDRADENKDGLLTTR